MLIPSFTTDDVDQLRTWLPDIRQIISDNAIKDMLTELDNSFFGLPYDDPWAELVREVEDADAASRQNEES